MKGRILVAVQFLCILALIMLPGADASTTARTATAVALIVLGAVILLIAFANLRESITVFPEPRDGVPFITSGIYAFVRHPMYLGVLLGGAGMVVWKWTFVSLGVWCVLLVDLRLKYAYEDGLLAARWPTAAAYQAQVGALWPKLLRTR